MYGSRSSVEFVLWSILVSFIFIVSGVPCRGRACCFSSTVHIAIFLSTFCNLQLPRVSVICLFHLLCSRCKVHIENVLMYSCSFRSAHQPSPTDLFPGYSSRECQSLRNELMQSVNRKNALNCLPPGSGIEQPVDLTRVDYHKDDHAQKHQEAIEYVHESFV